MSVYLRKALLTDCKRIFDWANDADVRKNAINQEEILWEDHVKWYNKVLADANSQLYIFMFEETPAGQIRLDKKSDGCYITYAIAKEQRGKGLGKLIIKHGLQKIKNCNVFAIVRCENQASLKIFSQLDFNKCQEENVDDDCFIKFMKKV